LSEIRYSVSRNVKHSSLTRWDGVAVSAARDVVMNPMEQYTPVDLSHFVLKRILTKFH